MSVNVSISRSPLRLLAYATFAVPAILLAVDMLFSYRWYPEPASYDQVVGTTIDQFGQTVDVYRERYTQDGQAQRRRDLLTGGALLVGGSAAMAWGLKELLRPTALLRADDEGISVRIDGPGRPPRLFPWEEVAEVRSGVLVNDGAEVAVLSLRLRDAGMVPADPAGAEPDPPWVHLFADEWDRPAHQVAPLLEVWVARSEPSTGG